MDNNKQKNEPQQTVSHRVRLTNDSINSYGSRILTKGVDIEQYKRNPVLLWMHRRGEVIGYLENIEQTETEITADIVFDLVSERSQQCAAQWNAQSLRMVSVGIEIVEESNDQSVLIPGQTRGTITRSKLFEVSVVDVGANDDAVRLARLENNNLLFTTAAPIAAITAMPPTNNNSNNMDNPETPPTVQDAPLRATLTEALGIEATASDNEIMENVVSLNAQIKNLNAQIKNLNATITAELVATAISEGRIEASAKKTFIQMGNDHGNEYLTDVLKGIPTDTARLTSLLNLGTEGSEWQKLSEVPEEEMIALRRDNPKEYARLYRAEYGIDCQL